MKTTENGMNMIYSGYILAMTYDINQPTMTTTDKNDQPKFEFIY